MLPRAVSVQICFSVLQPQEAGFVPVIYHTVAIQKQYGMMQEVVIHTPRITENKTPENMPATARNIRRYTTARYQLMYSDARCKILTWPDTLPDAKHSESLTV